MRWVSVVARWLLCGAALWGGACHPTAGRAQTFNSANGGLGLLIDEATVQRVAARLRKDMETGISGAVTDVQDCYRAATKTKIERKRLRDCMALDGAVKWVDDGFIRGMQAQGSRITENSLPYLETYTYNGRMAAYGAMLFSDVQAGIEYFQGVPARIVIGYMSMKKGG
jgi:hypothetical protein